MERCAARFALIAGIIALLCGTGAAAQSLRRGNAPPVRSGRNDRTKKPWPVARLVAYDAHDRRYYDLTWARAHQMRDPAGDTLVAVPMNRLPHGTNPAMAFRFRAGLNRGGSASLSGK